MSENVNQAGAELTAGHETSSDGSGSGSPPLIPPVEPTPEQQELERLRAENAELRQRQLESERDTRIKQAVAAIRVQDGSPNVGEQAVRRHKAVAQTGGLAFWSKLSTSDRVNILTDGQRVPATTEEIGKYFGSQSSANAAVQLKTSNPRAYRSYRAEAIELGLIGG